MNINMRKSLSRFTALVILMVLTTSLVYSKETGFLNRTVKIGQEAYNYQVYVPRNWSKNQKWPVILFLHGAGERGDDGFVQTEVGIGTAIRKYNDRFPAVIVIPQCRKNVWWTDANMELQALQALEKSIREFKGDRERIYLTGLSMGGYGTWSIAAENPGMFAAFVPICGGVVPPKGANLPDSVNQLVNSHDPYGEVARKIGKTPVWIFHGADDKVVPPDESRKMNEALKTAGGDVKYTEYEKVAHDSWNKAYAEKELMIWMLSKKKLNQIK